MGEWEQGSGDGGVGERGSGGIREWGMRDGDNLGV